MMAEKDYRISGHESFPCRYTWLPKAVRGLHDNPKLFSKEEDAMVALGVAVQSYRSHWNLIDSVIESFATEDELHIKILKTVGILNLLNDVRRPKEVEAFAA